MSRVAIISDDCEVKSKFTDEIMEASLAMAVVFDICAS